MESLFNYFQENGWSIVHREERAGRIGQTFPSDDLGLSDGARKLIYANGIYGHQREAIRAFSSGENVAITTATASGKTLVFNVCAAELLLTGNHTILALYPLKALGKEQAQRWKAMLKKIGLEKSVGYIDGSVGQPERLRILKECRVLVATPDILHAWILRQGGQADVVSFIRRLKLLVIDEAHSYTSVFGSNAAYVFRRLEHACQNLGGSLRYIAASATMDAPLAHLEKLTGRTFREVEESTNTAPLEPVEFIFVRPGGGDGLTALGNLLSCASEIDGAKTIAFVDSRQLAEHAAVIAGRRSDAPPDEFERDLDEALDELKLPKGKVLPYRSGYAAQDREAIQRALTNGKLRAVVSTSALELGIDIPGLNLCILYGIPPSGSSFRQRYGRVGRDAPGTVVIIDDGSPRAVAIFKDPSMIWALPLTKSSLYLHNRQAQYIHAMCLASQNGEDQAFAKAGSSSARQFSRTGLFPDDFIALCQAEHQGSIPQELRYLRDLSGDSPNLSFPLRDIGLQFRILNPQRFGKETLGDLSHAQLMREAYPGAIYYHIGTAYRVFRVSLREREVLVRREKHYFTSAKRLPSKIFPEFRSDKVFCDLTQGTMRVVECGLNIRETLVGFREFRGGNKFDVDYPLDPALRLYFDQKYFSRNWSTSGVILTHPQLAIDEVDLTVVASFVLEAFLMEIPFDRQDVGAGVDKIQVGDRGLREGQYFICLYDKQATLRLSGAITEEGALRKVLERAHDLAKGIAGIEGGPSAAVLNVLQVLAMESVELPVMNSETALVPTSDRYAPVIRPGSIGIDPTRQGEDFHVTNVLWHPKFGLGYHGTYVSEERRAVGVNGNGPAQTFLAVGKLQGIPGLSSMSWYDKEEATVVNEIEGEF